MLKKYSETESLSAIFAVLKKLRKFLFLKQYREVSEWLKEHAWKVCIRETVSRVRIPSSLLQHLFYLSLLPAGQGRSHFSPLTSHFSPLLPHPLKSISLFTKMLQHFRQSNRHSIPGFGAIMKEDNGAGTSMV